MEELNKEQKEAVETDSKNTLVIAGAGSGKTKVLTNRLAYLINNDVSENKIMAVTFTNKAANEMKERVLDILDKKNCEATMGTFHSICLMLLKKYENKELVPKNFSVANDKKKEKIIKKIIKEVGKEEEINHRSVKSIISNFKINLESPEEAEQKASKALEKDMAMIYSKYEDNLRNNNLLDFDDLITKTVKMLQQDKEIRNKVCGKYDYILVDEYQDTNYTQLKLIEILSKDSNVFVVGDDEQSIYMFRLSDVRNILNFKDKFEGTKVYKLERNYRSTANILNAANDVIKNNKSQMDKTLWTQREDGAKIIVSQLPEEYAEADYICEKINDLTHIDYNYKDITVMYRTNFQSRVIEQEMIRRNIPYKVMSGQKFFDRMEVMDMIAYISLAINKNDSISLERIINVPKRGIGKSTVEKIKEHAVNNNTSMWQACKDIKLSDKIRKKIDGFMEVVEDITKSTDKYETQDVLRRLYHVIRYEDYIKKAGSLEDRKENLEELCRMAEGYDDLGIFLEKVTLMSDQDELGDDNYVKLMTIHASKGLEFPVVLIAGVEEKVFPHINSMNTDEELEEERRLFYVGMTRAEDRLLISWCNFRGGMEKEESRFIKEIPKEYRKLEEA